MQSAEKKKQATLCPCVLQQQQQSIPWNCPDRKRTSSDISVSSTSIENVPPRIWRRRAKEVEIFGSGHISRRPWGAAVGHMQRQQVTILKANAHTRLLALDWRRRHRRHVNIHLNA